MTDQLDLFPNPIEPIEPPLDREDWIEQVAQAGVRRNNPDGTSKSLLGATALGPVDADAPIYFGRSDMSGHNVFHADWVRFIQEARKLNNG